LSADFDAQNAFSGAVEPQGADRLDTERLSTWLAANVEGFEGPLALRKFAGGQSNPTYHLSTPGADYVLRRKPFGELLPSAHAVDREYRVQRALYADRFPVARQHGLCTDEAVIGSWFYVMDMVDGRTIWNGAMPDASKADRREAYGTMVDTLAALHNVDVERAGLADYGRPGNYFARQVERWTKQYRLAETETVPEMERLIAFLPASVPEQSRVSIVHGDYRIDNLIWSKDGNQVRAVLDWELSTLGDPLADLTYFAMAWATENDGRSGVADVDRTDLGIPELEELVERYCTATGRTGLPDMNWYLAYNFFRVVGIVQGVRKRLLDGNASSANAEAMVQNIVPWARKAWDFARKAGA